MKKILVALFVLALATPAIAFSDKWTGFKILTITIDEPFEGWYPYEIMNTSTDPVCFSYKQCEDAGKPDANNHIGNDHKQECTTKNARLKPGKSLNPDQNYGPPMITKIRSCE